MGKWVKQMKIGLSVGGYGIPAIPTQSAGHSWQSGSGRDAIPSYYNSELLLTIPCMNKLFDLYLLLKKLYL